MNEQEQPNMQEVDKDHFTIRHEWMEDIRMVDVRYIQFGNHLPRLYLQVGESDVFLTDNETGYFLAWMSTWYDRGGD